MKMFYIFRFVCCLLCLAEVLRNVEQQTEQQNGQPILLTQSLLL